MRIAIRVAAVLLVLLNMPSTVVCAQSQSSREGLSVAEFRDFSSSLPKLPGRILAIRLFDEISGQTTSVAVLTRGDRSGWQIFVFRSSQGRNFRLQWKSGKLDDTFYVSDPSNLHIFSFMGGRQGVQFSGCAAHSCPHGVFSALLYIPSKQTAFIAKSVLGKVSYSPELESPGNQQYKNILSQLVKELARQ